MAQLRPFDVFEIQTAIDVYERKHPRTTTPSAGMALTWRLRWRRRVRAVIGVFGRQAKQRDSEQSSHSQRSIEG